MNQVEHMARAMDAILDDGFGLSAKPKLQPAPRYDATLTAEDMGCTLLADYRIDDYGNKDDAPRVTIVRLWADFGGRDQVPVPLSAISGEMLSTLEMLAADEVTQAEYENAERARQGEG